MKGIYRACGELGWPMVFDFRLTTTGVTDPIGMPYLEECLKEFPNAVFVGHGPGWWAEMSARFVNGYMENPVTIALIRALQLLPRTADRSRSDPPAQLLTASSTGSAT